MSTSPSAQISAYHFPPLQSFMSMRCTSIDKGKPSLWRKKNFHMFMSAIQTLHLTGSTVKLFSETEKDPKATEQ